MAYGTPTCGNCGTDLRPYFGGPLGRPVGTSVPGGFIRALVILGILFGAGFFLIDPIREAVEDFEETFTGVDRVEGDAQVIEEQGIGGFRNVRALARALNDGGLRCRSIVVDQADEYTTTGSCQAGGTHVQINIYRQPLVLRAARDTFKDGPFTWVHDDGWFVITQPQVAREVHAILGGRLRIRS